MCDSMDVCGALENVRGINSTIQHEPAVLKSLAHFMPGLISFKRKTFLSFVTCSVGMQLFSACDFNRSLKRS